jgi:hypothetical protein
MARKLDSIEEAQAEPAFVREEKRQYERGLGARGKGRGRGGRAVRGMKRVGRRGRRVA